MDIYIQYGFKEGFSNGWIFNSNLMAETIRHEFGFVLMLLFVLSVMHLETAYK